jgi:hypothetical protein
MRKVVWALLMTVAAGLTGCASPTISNDYKLPSDRHVGLAAGSITYSGSRGLYRVYLVNVDTGQRFRFEIGSSSATPVNLFTSAKDEDLGVDGRPFATELPAGRYHITGWGAAAGAVRASAGLVVGVPFTVEAGKSIYMGNFHFTGRLTPFTGVVSAALKDEASRDVPVLKKRFPVLANVPLHGTLKSGTQLPLVGGYGRISDPAQVYTTVER